MAQGKVYLRPSADVSLEHKILPDSLTAGYIAISERVCDGDATCVQVSASSSSATSVRDSGTSKFIMSAGGSRVKSITNAVIVMYFSRTGYGYSTVALYIDGVLYSNVMEADYIGNKYDAKDDDLGCYIRKVTLSDEIISVINSYISAYGHMPSIEAEIYSEASEDSDQGKAVSLSAYFRISQIFIELECDYVSEVSYKVSEIWKPVTASFKRSGGSWVETNLGDVKNILQSNLVIDKCKCRGHIETQLSNVNPTCLDTGMTGGQYCSYCGNTLKEHDTVIPALGHNNIDMAGTATCTEDGMMGGTKCSRCGIVTKEHDTVQPALGHVETALADTKATCTAEGATGGIKCSRCGITLKEHDTVIPAKGHNYRAYDGYCTNGCYGYHPDSFTFTIQRDTQTTASTYHAMSGITWGDWAGNSSNYFWYVDSDGRIRYTYSSIKYYIDGVTKDDVIISGNAYTATDAT